MPAGDSTLGKIIADGQLYAASSKEAGGAQIAFMNSGGIRADMKAGELTYGDIFTVQPFSNVVVTQSLTGAQIKQALEQQWIVLVHKLCQFLKVFTTSGMTAAQWVIKLFKNQ